jgi:hypothetical protein
MWVRQGRTDAWIAHKLDISVDELGRFKREHDLQGGDEGARARPADPLSVPAPEPPLTDFAEPEEEEEAEEAAEEREPARARPRRRSRGRPRRSLPVDEDEELDFGPPAGTDEDEPEPREPDRRDRGDAEPDGAARRPRRRGRRGGRRHRGRRNAFEATFDHGEEGYGLWLDPAVADDSVYSEHWAGHRAVIVTVEAEAITIRRAGRPAGTASEPGLDAAEGEPDEPGRDEPETDE